MKPRNIYLASSWKNEPFYNQVLRALRDAGHSVYDFRTAKANFRWEEMDLNWEQWTPDQFIEAISTDQSIDAFESDLDALEACDTCVLVLPAGNSAHLELGFAAGAGKDAYTLVNAGFKADLMVMVGHVISSVEELLEMLEEDVRQ